MDRFENVAIPWAADCVAGPDRVPAPGFATIARVTLPAYAVSVLPNWSRAVTCGTGAIDAPATVLPGCTVKNSVVAAAGATLKPVAVAPVRPVALAASV